MNDLDVINDSLGDAKKIFRAIIAISASDYLVKQELAVLRVRVEPERGQVFNSSGKALFFIIGFSKDLHSSSMGTEDNIEASTMEHDSKDYINGL